MLAHTLVSFPSTRRGCWLVRGSIYQNDSICIVAFNTETNETRIQYFLNEDRAYEFVSQLL